MNENKIIQIISIILSAGLTVLFANLFPQYTDGITASQSWFAATLLGVVIAWSVYKFVPNMLGEENKAVDIKLPGVVSAIANRGVEDDSPAPVTPLLAISSNENAEYILSLRESIINAWHLEFGEIKDAYKLRFNFDRVVIGPTTISVFIKLHYPTARTKKTILGNIKQSLSAMSAVSEGDIGINIDKGILYIDFPNPNPKTPNGPELSMLTPDPIELSERTEEDRRDMFATVGLNRGSNPMHIDMSKYPTVGFFGPSGRGKTSALITALYTICDNTTPDRFQFVVMAEKLDTWIPWLESPFCAGVYLDAESIDGAMRNLISNEFENRRRDEWGDFPSLLVIVDDLADVSMTGDSFTSGLGKISTSGRSTRMYLWASTQAGGSNQGLGNMLLGTNMMYRIVFATSDPSEAYRASGVKSFDLSLSNNLGDCYIVVDGRPIRAATGFTNSKQIKLLGEGVNYGSMGQNTPPPEKWANSTEKWAKTWSNDGQNGLPSGPLNGPPKNVGERDLSDDECVLIWYAEKSNGGEFSKRALMMRLWDNANTTSKRKLKIILERAEQILEFNDTDVLDQIDVDVSVLGDED